MGNRWVPLVVVTLAVLAAGAGVWMVLLASPHLAPEPAAVVVEQPQAPRPKTPADFTVIAPPQPAPQTPFSDESGRVLTLADFRGQVVLLNLWATWCGPCVEEMPSLDRLQAELGGDSFAVLALSQDRQGAAVVKPFFDKLGLTRLPVFIDAKGTLTRDLGARGLPTSFVLDRDGRLVGRLEGAAAWDAPEWVDHLRRIIAAPSPAGS
jgi:thiol-disulfide isomerase/thioredoxin